MWRLLHISVISSSNTFQFLPTDTVNNCLFLMQLIFYCWLQVCSRGDLTSEWWDTSMLMTCVYCCRCMMGWTLLPKKLVATALPLHWQYAQHQITCSSNSVQTCLLVDEVSISVTKQVRVRLLSYIWLAVLFVHEKIYFSCAG
jgi:hypothetical protein